MKIIFATNNPNKLREVEILLPDYIKVSGLKDIGCLVDIPETQPTIEGNATQKADFVHQNFDVNCFADDTGLEVEALNGEPGVKSAKYAGLQRNSEDNMDKLLKNLEGKTNRNAQFKTVIALILNNELKLFTGICKGKITLERRGKDGFGYDPIFQPDGFEKTFAEMSLEEKNEIGHRGIAVKQLTDYLSDLQLSDL